MTDAVNSAPPPTILVIDTSTAQGAVALYDGQRISSRSWPAERNHTTTSLAQIHRLLDDAGITSDTLAAIGVATGPGAFTALRVGMGLAKGFHLAANTPLVGVPTLLATALPFSGLGRPIIATLPAGRGRLVWARYEGTSPAMPELDAPRSTARNTCCVASSAAVSSRVTRRALRYTTAWWARTRSSKTARDRRS